MGHLLADHGPALAPSAGRRRTLHLHGFVERIPRPTHLPATPRAIHARPGPASLPEPTRRHRMESAHGGVDAGDPARGDPLPADAEDVYSRNINHGIEVNTPS